MATISPSYPPAMANLAEEKKEDTPTTLNSLSHRARLPPLKESLKDQYTPPATRVRRAVSTVGIKSANRASLSAQKLHRLYQLAFYYGLGEKAHPDSHKLEKWWRAYHLIGNAVCFVPVLTAGKAMDPMGTSTSPLWCLMLGCLVLNCTFKRINRSRWVKDGGAVDAVCLNLSEESAARVLALVQRVQNRTTGKNSKYFPFRSLDMTLSFCVGVWLPPLVDGDEVSHPYPVHAALYFAGMLVFNFTLNYEAVTTTLLTFLPLGWGLSLSAKDLVKFIHTAFKSDYDLLEDDDEESLLAHREGGGDTDDASNLRTLIERFNILKATVRNFSSSYGVFFLVAEFTLIPGLIALVFILYEKLRLESLNSRDACLVGLAIYLIIFLVSLIGGLFAIGVHITSALEEVTNAVEEARSRESLMKGDIPGFEIYLKKVGTCKSRRDGLKSAL